MAKLPDEDMKVAIAGFQAAHDATNPYLWSSTYWEQWSLGRMMACRGLVLGQVEKRRGSVYELPSGFRYKAVYNSKKGEMAWERVA